MSLKGYFNGDKHEYVSISTSDFDSLLIMCGGKLLPLAEQQYNDGKVRKKFFMDPTLPTAYFLLKKTADKDFKAAIIKYYQAKNVKLGQLLFEFTHDERDDEWKKITKTKIIKKISKEKFSREELEGVLMAFEDKHEDIRNLISGKLHQGQKSA